MPFFMASFSLRIALKAIRFRFGENRFAFAGLLPDYHVDTLSFGLSGSLNDYSVKHFSLNSDEFKERSVWNALFYVC